MVRIEHDRAQETVVPHAVAIARALDRPLSLIALINEDRSSSAPADPVQWDLRRRDAELHLRRIEQAYRSTGLSISTCVLEQFLPEDMGLRDGEEQLILAFSRHSDQLPWQSDSASRDFVRRLCPSLLMVPMNVPPNRQVSYSRIVVPLDGSSLAESALPAALSLARYHQARLRLVHATTEPEFMVRGPLEAEALELGRQVRGRNARVAKSYLNDLQSRLQGADVTTDTRLISAGDARRLLVTTAKEEATDLIVMASHGSGNWGDVPTGSVASFILEHAVQPVLMVSRNATPVNEHLWLDSTLTGARRADVPVVSA